MQNIKSNLALSTTKILIVLDRDIQDSVAGFMKKERIGFSNGPCYLEVMKEIMYGYDCVVRLTDAEKKATPYVILANQFVSTAFFAGKDKYEDLYKINKTMTEWIGRNMEKLCIS